MNEQRIQTLNRKMKPGPVRQRDLDTGFTRVIPNVPKMDLLDFGRPEKMPNSAQEAH